MMGSAEEAGGPPRQPQKATFSGMTMCIGIIALIVDIISVSAPHWGYYAPAGIIYASSGFNGQDNTGHFGPFQHCKNSVYKSFCGSDGVFQPTVWLLIAGLSAVFAILTLVLFCVFALLHVAMQIQRTEICISFKRALFLKFVTSCVAVVATIFAVGLGAVQFSTGGRSSALRNSIGICYYLQIILVFVNILLAVMSYLSYRKAGKHPLNIVSKGNAQHGMAYELKTASAQPFLKRN
ncbi:uncharacterized protein LOC131877968 isoform X2 [Tigriopus californicus]|uniref:uncharacterized protein LOC131877968 isoform X2 n=1 Tax=Tigriopus californicus TaxID=6832 RepID=UPI0027DA461C|nr:uncharacterized protein LOC131877968 isoform X2 [Tigriopus californicus]